MICLKPLGSSALTRSSHQGARATLAVAGPDLPPSLALDWSYEFEVVKHRWSISDLSLAEFGVETAGRLGSVVAIERIPPEVLRVRTKDDPADPARWPLLVETLLDRVHILPATLGYDDWGNYRL